MPASLAKSPSRSSSTSFGHLSRIPLAPRLSSPRASATPTASDRPASCRSGPAKRHSSEKVRLARPAPTARSAAAAASGASGDRRRSPCPTGAPRSARRSNSLLVESHSSSASTSKRPAQSAEAGLASGTGVDQRHAADYTPPPCSLPPSRPSSSILRVIVLRPMPSTCAASMRRPPVCASARAIRMRSKVWRQPAMHVIDAGGEQAIDFAFEPGFPVSRQRRRLGSRAIRPAGRRFRPSGPAP